MAIVIQCEGSDEVSFEAFLDYVDAHVDTADRDSFLAASDILVRLSRNKRFLALFLENALRAAINAHGANDRPSRIFVLANTERYVIRALIWEPVSHGADGSQFFYHIPHDHDFDFLTVCCSASGLSSEVYQYDNDRIRGEKGEAVEIRHQGRITLRPGVAVFFEGGKDIHSQLPPEEVCVTINIMGPKRVERSPFWFDVASGNIVDWVDHSENIQKLMVAASKDLSTSPARASAPRVGQKMPPNDEVVDRIVHD